MEEGKVYPTLTTTVRRGDGVLCTVNEKGELVPVQTNQEPVNKDLGASAPQPTHNDDEVTS